MENVDAQNNVSQLLIRSEAAGERLWGRFAVFLPLGTHLVIRPVRGEHQYNRQTDTSNEEMNIRFKVGVWRHLVAVLCYCGKSFSVKSVLLEL